MEDSIQVVVGIIISVFIFFVFPVYMAYEKLDDISYVLAMRYTQDFVDNVRNKGYITKEMYEDYKVKLNATGNSYDIEMTHRKTRIDPIVQYYKVNWMDPSDGYSLVSTSSLQTRKNQENAWAKAALNEGVLPDFINIHIESKYSALGINKVLETYLVEEEVYTTKDIEAVLNTENKLWVTATTDNFTCIDDADTEDLVSSHKKVKGCQYAYIMNENDNFNVIIRNTNTTVATAIYNMITVNTVDNNTRIYVNYGGTIDSEKWYGKVDYSKMKHDNLEIEKKTKMLLFEETKKLVLHSSPINIPPIQMAEIMDKKSYILEFEAKPFDITELREKGYVLSSEEISGDVLINDGLYNIVAGSGNNHINDMSVSCDYLTVSVGLNGVAILDVNPHTQKTKVILMYPMTISEFKKFRIEVGKYSSTTFSVELYIDDIKVDENNTLSKFPVTLAIGSGYLRYLGSVNRLYFNGYVRNAYIYY